MPCGGSQKRPFNKDDFARELVALVNSYSDLVLMSFVLGYASEEKKTKEGYSQLIQLTGTSLFDESFATAISEFDQNKLNKDILSLAEKWLERNAEHAKHKKPKGR